MRNSLVAPLIIVILIVLFGCLGDNAPNSSAGASAPDQEYVVRNISYPINLTNVSALWCEPKNVNISTPGIVLTGGDGVTLEKLRPVCEAFAKKGIIAIAHDNVNGSIGDNVEAISAGAMLLRQTSANRPVSLWGHSSGTIFSFFAAYSLAADNVRISAFVETSGHFQLPICDNTNEQMVSYNGQNQPCMAYLDEFPSPIMIVHGLNDSVVSPDFAYALAARLAQDNIAHDQAYVPDAAHEFMTNYTWVLEKEVVFVKNNGR